MSGRRALSLLIKAAILGRCRCTTSISLLFFLLLLLTTKCFGLEFMPVAFDVL
jgi:hypothetical protein